MTHRSGRSIGRDPRRESSVPHPSIRRSRIRVRCHPTARASARGPGSVDRSESMGRSRHRLRPGRCPSLHPMSCRPERASRRQSRSRIRASVAIYRRSLAIAVDADQAPGHAGLLIPATIVRSSLAATSVVLTALFADVHANLEALNACLTHAKSRGAERFAFLGDLVGYGADARAVVEVVCRYAARGGASFSRATTTKPSTGARQLLQRRLPGVAAVGT